MNCASLDAEYSAGRHFLKNGWMHLAEACGINSHERPLKANTFMASMGRIDDFPRMGKTREKKPGMFEVETYSVNDRERMMGFPEGYVEEPLKDLFEKMTEAFVHPDWTTAMPELAKFSGLPYSFKPQQTSPFFLLKAGPPLPHKQKTQYYFSSSEYAKHLIGNAFSIPVMEHLLKPLTQLFASKQHEGYSYPYPWPPHNLGVNDDASE